MTVLRRHSLKAQCAIESPLQLQFATQESTTTIASDQIKDTKSPWQSNCQPTKAKAVNQPTKPEQVKLRRQTSGPPNRPTAPMQKKCITQVQRQSCQSTGDSPPKGAHDDCEQSRATVQSTNPTHTTNLPASMQRHKLSLGSNGRDGHDSKLQKT